jgi:hypothetical protein
MEAKDPKNSVALSMRTGCATNLLVEGLWKRLIAIV